MELLEKSTGDNRPGFEKDRVRALDMLAAYYVQRGNQERAKEARREWFDKATVLYAMADRVSRYLLRLGCILISFIRVQDTIKIT